MAEKQKTGQGVNELKENVPVLAARFGDGVITAERFGGVNNNASIVLGRDRTSVPQSGYGAFERAGAIDIVVGRGSPKSPGKLPNQPPPVYIDPLFKATKETRLEQIKVENVDLIKDCQTIMMDAARIYLSQKSNIDKAFGIIPTINGPRQNDDNPRSSIGMKADGVRIIAREGVKIVTMGAGAKFPENVSSQGNKIVKTYGIDLIAGNGKDAKGNDIPQEPLVCGNRMMTMIGEMANIIDNLTGILSTFVAQQSKINVALGLRFGVSGAGVVVMDPVTNTVIGTVGIDIMAKTGISLFNLKQNLAKFKIEHGCPGAMSAADSAYGGSSRPIPYGKSPLSKFNTTN